MNPAGRGLCLKALHALVGPRCLVNYLSVACIYLSEFIISMIAKRSQGNFANVESCKQTSILVRTVGGLRAK